MVTSMPTGRVDRLGFRQTFFMIPSLMLQVLRLDDRHRGT